MDKLKTILNQYFWLIIVVFLAAIAFLSFSIYRNYQASRFEKTIGNQNIEAGKAKNEASNANVNAANFDVNRRTEDVIREKTIAPKLDAARRASEKSSQKIKILKKQINENEKVIHNINASVADNCAELHELFPDERFEYCHDR